MSSFSTNKSQLLVCLHCSTIWQLFMRPHPMMNERQLTSFCSLKIHHMLIFWWTLPSYQSWSKACFRTDTLIECEALPRPNHLVMIEISSIIQVRRTKNAGNRWRNKDNLISDFLLWTSTPKTCKCFKLSYFLVQLCLSQGQNAIYFDVLEQIG